VITLVNGVETDQVSVMDRGFQYGDGLFETIAAYRGTPLLWTGHLLRLRRGCERLHLDMPDETLLWQETARVVDGAERAVVKITLTHGPAGRGYARVAWAPPTRVVSARHWPNYPATHARDGVDLRWCQTTVPRNPCLAGIKHLNRLAQVMARAEWETDYAEGLMCDEAGFVIEGTMSNVFGVFGDTVITPDLSQSGVAGVMRAEVMRAARSCGLVCREDWITPATLATADELFLTNSIIGVWPVRTLAARSYTIGQATHTIQKAIEAAQCFAPVS
jgi:4-amino-4-deoxychorismate lyase